MSQLLDLKRCWRMSHTPSQIDGRKSARWWLNQENVEMLERLGFHRIDSLAKQECIFLLGRPGAGKTAEIERIKAGQVSGFSDECCIVVPCKEMNGPDVDRELDRSPAWRDACQQGKPIRLILDALDEGFLRDNNYFALLKRSLEYVRARNPKLRLALICRPAEWDDAFGSSIHSTWGGEGAPSVYALEPLSRWSQDALIESWGTNDRDEFFAWVTLNNFEEFAMWPRSLKWLAEHFGADGSGRVSFTDLCMRRAVRSFPEDERIVEANRTGQAPIWTHALMVVAAATVFCGKKGIALKGIDEACLTLDEIFRGGSLLEISGKPSLTRENLREAIRASDLMETCGTHHRFQNQSDLEYLAAAMLATLGTEQLSELFGCADELGQWRVFPQLATTAANLATQSRDFFQWVLAHDPRILMRMDFASKPTEDKRSALDAIFHATTKADATAEHNQHSHFATLQHHDIEEQIRPWLFDNGRSYVVRKLAFDIASACCGMQFWEEFDRIVATVGDDFLESRLASALYRFGKNWPENRLCEIASLPDSGVAAAAMTALLDKGWRPSALAPFLRRTTGSTYDGYDMLLGMRLPKECNADDVPILLPKIADWPTTTSFGRNGKTLEDALIASGVSNLGRSDVREAVVEFILARSEHYTSLFDAGRSEELARLNLDDPEHRRELVLALADVPSLAEEPIQSRIHFPVLFEDFSWLLEEIMMSHGVRAINLTRVAASAVWQSGHEHAELLDRAYNSSNEMRAMLPQAEEGSVFKTISRLRAEAKERQRLQAEEYRSQLPNRPRYNNAAHFTKALSRCRAGYVKEWSDLCLALTQPRSAHDSSIYFQQVDIRQLPGWLAASNELRAELIQYARRFLLEIQIPEPLPNRIPDSFFGLIYALSLFGDELRGDAELCAAIKPIWFQALLRRGDSHDDWVAEFIRTLIAVAPKIATDGFEMEFRACWSENGILHHPVLALTWSPQIEEALNHALSQSPLQATTYETGLALLTQHNIPLAESIARKHLTEFASRLGDSSRRSAIAACLFTVDTLWKEAWTHFVEDPNEAKESILEHQNWLDVPSKSEKLAGIPSDFVSALYRMMLVLFPLHESPRIAGPRELTSIDRAYDLQSKLQTELEERGEYTELKSIYEQSSVLHDAWWLGQSLERAITHAHARRRHAPNASQFVQFIATDGGVFVRDNASLQNAVVASLRRFEKQIHPLVITALWEHAKPRNEEALQIEITRHFKNEFEAKKMVVNMEVKVERKQGIDILVEAPPYSVTVEVKQGHAKDKDRPILDSMRLQLRDIYLASSRRTHGIYVVGWYSCFICALRGPQGMKNIEEARNVFDEQAQQLSTDGYSLAAVVLDCRWKESITARSKKRKTTKDKRRS